MYNKISRKKMTALLASLSAILVVIVMVVISSNDVPERLYSSDLIGANFALTNTLNPEPSNKLLFFTGTAIAEAEISDKSIKTQSLTKEYPFQRVEKAYYEDTTKTALLKIFYEADTAYYSLPDIQDGWQWVIVDQQGARLLPSINNKQKLVDAIMDEDGIYTSSSNPNENSYRIDRFDINENRYTTLSSSTKGHIMSSSLKDHIVMRDYSLNLHILNKETGSTETMPGVAEAKSDRTCNCILYTASSEATHTHSAAGEAPSGASRDEGVKRTVFFLEKNARNSVTTPKGSYFISDGQLLAIPSQTDPSYIDVFDLKPGDIKHSRVTVINETPVKDPINNLVLLGKGFENIGVVSSFGGLTLYSAKERNDMVIYELPVFNGNSQFSYDYSAAYNQVTILTDDRNYSTFQESLKQLSSSCGCDTNQVGKKWELPELNEDDLYD